METDLSSELLSYLKVFSSALMKNIDEVDSRLDGLLATVDSLDSRLATFEKAAAVARLSQVAPDYCLHSIYMDSSMLTSALR